jgi:hypothetical protein
MISNSKGGKMNKLNVKIESFQMGNDLIIFLFGGDMPHIGAVALAIPYRNTASASLLTVQGHKDGDLAKPLSEKMAKQLGKKVLLIVGIHVDNASSEEINQLVENSEELIDKFIKDHHDKK